MATPTPFHLPTVHQFDPITTAPASATRSFGGSGTAQLLASSSATYPSTGTTGWPSASNTDENAAFTTSWITYLAIVVVAGVFVAVISSRFFYIRRFYERPSLRAYFIPRNGIHWSKLGVHIKGAPGRIESTVNYMEEYGASAHQRAERRRRRRRDRQTVGETLGAGGTRLGQRDEDDVWDDEVELDAEEREIGGDGTMVERRRARVRDDLPAYVADSGLPAYAAPPPPVGHAEHGSEPAPNATDGTGRRPDEVDLPTAAEYEALSRAGRDGAPSTLHLPTYPPAVHVHGVPPSPAWPTEPPPSFSRANSGVSTRSRMSMRRRDLHPLAVAPTTTTSSRSGSIAGGEAEDGPQGRSPADARSRTDDFDARRRDSTATSSSSSTKDLVETFSDDDERGHKTRIAPSTLVASGSKVTLDSTTTAGSVSEEGHGRPDGAPGEEKRDPDPKEQ
ncbi:hypothetical protein JCM10212_000176 [Sporobolomyces blumeae]